MALENEFEGQQNQDEGGDTEGGGALDVQSIADYAMELVQDQCKTHPFRTMGVAMGVGYVLGGGIPKFLVRLGMLAAGRILADAVTIEGVRTLAGDVMGQEAEGGQDDRPRGQARSRNGHHRKRGQGERQARRE
jgi:hypothetical protein